MPPRLSRYAHTLPAALGLLAALISVGAWAAPPPPPPRPFSGASLASIATGSVTGAYFPVGGAICRLVNLARATHGLHCLVAPSGGSLDNLEAMRAGEVGFAIVQSDWQYLAHEGAPPLTERGAFETLRAVFSLHAEPVAIVVRGGVSAERFEDLKGKRLALGPAGSPGRLAAEALLAARGRTLEGFSPADIQDQPPDPQTLCDNKADAVLLTVAHPNGALKDAMGRCVLRLLPVEEETVRALTQRQPFLGAASIPGGLYPGAKAEVPTLGLRATLVTTSATPDTVVYALVKAVFDNFDDFRQLHPVLAPLRREEMVAVGLTAPLHPGAQTYYKEAGLIR
ncbi:TAXI family TRAP transporter solute-binding subunit [Pararhodospirillum photometricum]|nr:TAXI family TRAP transporter solute-binding subunit [Pararhodospirillum photometricum]